MSDTMEISIDEGTLWIVRQVLRRNGKPDTTITEATSEIMAILKEHSVAQEAKETPNG